MLGTRWSAYDPIGRMEAEHGEEYSDDVYRILKQEHGYSINMSHKKAPYEHGEADTHRATRADHPGVLFP